MSAKLLMLQGTGSSVGKSALVAGLCRLYRQRGFRVAPFKAQNMALNSFITPQGGEIGRAQAVQAEACGLEPHVDMNPVLIKPNSDVGAQVIIHGRVVGNMSAAVYHAYKETAWQAVAASLARLRREYELVIIEGAGSPAEINLRDQDIVNMGLALRVNAPVLLIGDIDKGGVFAALLGTLALLEPAERDLIKAFIVNKFRGDAALLTPGLEMITARCGTPFAGVVPWFGSDIYLPEEDGVALEQKNQAGPQKSDCQHRLAIAVIRLPHISNFTDFDPLRHEAGVFLRYLEPHESLVGFHLVILPGSKNTIADLQALTQVDFSRRLRAFAAAGGAVVGICGGYQMLGRSLRDPQMVESGCGEVEGFGLLPIVTEMFPEKVTVQCRARVCSAFLGDGLEVSGYEIHQGRTEAVAEAETLLAVSEKGGRRYSDGHVAAQGLIWGSYMHGIFDDDAFRGAYLAWLQSHFLPAENGCSGASPAAISYRQRKEQGLDALAEHLQQSLDLRMIDGFAGF
ncbi:MAG TPA: cobyric acid synthase [Proteobacteria bacterium]|nr:cobyric acid synthase [Pseudomonadota bacterium]